uniref:Uncharacterized protein n=1 Tax=Amphilophus citrinellus TaxID=61819 RepID=A0A3Q0QXC4_AMPCI
PHSYQRWAGDEDELQGPQADVGDGEDMVVAHTRATRLGSVAYKIFVLITPHPLKPDPTECCGVFVDPTNERLQITPVHDCCLRGGKRDHNLSVFVIGFSFSLP